MKIKNGYINTNQYKIIDSLANLNISSILDEIHIASIREGEALDRQYQQLSELYYQVQCLYMNGQNSAMHDDLLDTLSRIEDSMAQVSLCFDESMQDYSGGQL